MKTQFFILSIFLFLIPPAFCANKYSMVNPYFPDSNHIPEIDGYKYAWGDEFNQEGSVNTDLWSFETGFKRGNEPQIYVEGDNNAIIKEGRLLITAKKERRKNPRYDPSSSDSRLNTKYGEYTSASINGNHKRVFLFGRTEVRAKLDISNGAFPAIWTCGYNKEWPKNGEIDIMEYYLYHNTTPSLTSNFAAGKKEPWEAIWNSKWTQLTYYTAKDPDWVKKYHIYRMDWDEKEIKLYVDDELKNSIDINEFRNEDGSICFHNPQYMWLNLALKDQGKGIDITENKQICFEVDYFRLYQKIVDRESPSVVTELTTSEVSDTSCRLTWNRASDNVGVYRYDIYKDGMGSGGFFASTTDTTFLVTGLKASNEVRFFVRALDRAGNYSYYNTNLSFNENNPVRVKTLSEFGAIIVPNNIYTDIILKSTLSNGRKIIWTSSDPVTLSTAGLVALPSVEKKITLTASYTEKRTFPVKIYPRCIENNKLLYYRFEASDVYSREGKTYLKDKSGNGNDAILYGNAQVNGTLDLSKNTLSGESTNGYVMIPHNMVNNLRSYTCLMKIAPIHLNNAPCIFDFGSGVQNSFFGRLNTLCVGFIYAGKLPLLINSPATILLAQETLLAFTFDAKTKTTKVFLNGKETANGTSIIYEPYQLLSIAENTCNYIGRSQLRNNVANTDYCGTIDDFYLFNIALTQEEIEQIQKDKNTYVSSVQNDAVTISPNPANRYEDIVIYLNGFFSGECHIEILNTKGQVVLSKQTISPTVHLGSIYQPGYYFVQIINALKEKQVLKLIVK